KNLVLVDFACPKPGDEQLPDTPTRMQPHGVPATVPAVEITHHRDPTGIGRPDREAAARHATGHPGLRAEAAAEPAVVALVEQVDIHLAQLGTEGIGVLGLLQAAAPVDTQAIGPGPPELGHK